MRRRLLSLFAIAASLSALADARWELTTLKPFSFDDAATGGWQATWLSSLYQTGGGFAAGGNVDDQPSNSMSTAGNSNLGKACFRLEHGSWGFGVSELMADFNLGDYCTDFPAGEIDWAATRVAVESSQEYSDGYLYFVQSATEPTKRILFTRGGEVAVPWKLVGGEDATQIYTIGQTTQARPYRIFWTEKPFHGPKIDLASHPHVKLLGDPRIVKPVYEATATSQTTGVSNLVRGVVFDADSKVLRCYCRVIDEKLQQYDGPEGQFVLAYYDTGVKDNLIATVVVEACRPDVETIDAYVGDELRPTGGGYDIEGLESEIIQGASAVVGDDASPYLYKHSGKNNWSKKNKAVFAISPTDATTTKTGVAAPWRADIYWKSPDPLDTLWPFEQDWYKISWPENAPAFIVSDNQSLPGIPIFIPTNYTAAVCDYQNPAMIARVVDDESITATQPGYFTIKITTDDDVWFQPVRAVSRTDGEYAMKSAARWEIGSEITLLGGSAALNTSNAVLAVDGSIPGYIYAAGSKGRRNWNPRLYHEPKRDSVVDGISTGDDEDPFASLTSSIYPVNTSAAPIEVWWYSTVQQEDMDGELEIPCVVQKYNAVWPDERDLQDVVIASRRGSDGMISGASEKSIYFGSTNATASLSGDSYLSAAQTTGFTAMLWLNVSPKAADCPVAADGLVAHICGTNGDAVAAIELKGDAGGYAVEFNKGDYQVAPAAAGLSYPVQTNCWHHFAISIDPVSGGDDRTARLFVDAVEKWSGTIADAASVTNFILSLGARMDGGAVVAPAAYGVAVDEVAIVSRALTAADLVKMLSSVGGNVEAELAMQCGFDFDEAIDISPVVGTTERYAFDKVRGRILVCRDVLAMRPGAPALKSGLMQSCDGVDPEIYYENSSANDGFNPNDEHAFLLKNNRGWEVHALRCDLSDPAGSEPFVLAMYNDSGKAAMRVYDVKLTNEFYTVLGTNITAGLKFTQPYPLNVLEQADNARNYAKTVTDIATNSFGEVTDDMDVVYYDHFNRMWGRRDGEVDAYYYYAFRDGFWFPGMDAQPAAGTLVPWLCRIATNTADLIAGEPMPWRWSVAWPSDDEIGKMRVAQTLTTATGGLPEVWNASSMAVAFPAPAEDVIGRERVVHLIDPTAMRHEPLPIEKYFPDEYGFTLGPAGTTQLKKGNYYFTGLPPSVSDRLFVDAANQRICLIGQRVENVTGGPYMQLNVLTDAERQAIKGICKDTVKNKELWDAAVERLARGEIIPTRQTLLGRVVNEYTPVDHYALVASGEGTGYVTLIENDSTNTAMVAEGSPISMHVIKVIPELYAGGLTVLTDPMNKLSEQLTIAYNEPFGAAEGNFEFDWRRIETPIDGSVPTNYLSWNQYLPVTNGLTSILLGAAGADLKDLQNMYYAMRYRAKPGTSAYNVTGDTWSDWCGPQLAEGWVQRVLNSVTPFAQRCTDFSSYTSDIAYSMLEQIGAPYEGDVALNNDNLNNIGLLELYRTILNKAEAMSLKLGQKTDPGVNKQLLMAASRIAELYGILGDEAYSDAKNPTISQMFRGTEYDYDSLSASAFAFQNQMPSLLDEELALLRGRNANGVAPNMTTSPYYNRLIWNFTKDPCEGEVAYVNNYMIRGDKGEISAEQAKKQYPQGHGDAYGHYLSEVKSFYHLVRNEYFDWYASMTEMLIGGSVANVDYFDEEKFAAAAGDLAKTALDTMDLTARKAWRDSEGVSGAGYFDANSQQGFGYGEWATRGGFGALCNWAVVNSLLPTNGTPASQAFTDKGVARVDRSTASSLDYLPAAVADIERKLFSLDAGVNPLGISDNAVPFDLDPNCRATESLSPRPHFEQIRDRAEAALANAQTVQDYANQYGSRLAQIQLNETDAEATQEEVEADYNRRLIAIYGTPYSGDIGPGGLYAQGYDGPDIYHYQYVDLKPYGLDVIDPKLSTTIVIYKTGVSSPTSSAEGLGYKESKTIKVSYTLTPDGIPQPASDMGARRAEGTIQAAYRDFLAAYVRLSVAALKSNAALGALQTQSDIAKTKLRQAGADLGFDEIINAATFVKAGIDLTTGRVINAMEVAKDAVNDVNQTTIQSTPKIIGAGLTVNVDPSAVVGGISSVAAASAKNVFNSLAYGAKGISASYNFYLEELKTIVKGVKDGFDYYDAEVSCWERLKSAVSSAVSSATDLEFAYHDVIAAEQAYRTQIAAGEALREELEMQRRLWANTATSARYADMFNRIQRNSALSKYSTAYDTAQRFVFELAKVYDYETGLLSSDSQSGDAFLREIIAARSLGEKDITTDDGGTLWDAVTRMSRNWDTSLKGRLGVNNPENTVKWFSLRWSLLRIKPDSSGDEAWRAALRKYWTDDILSDPEFRRYCQPPQSESVDAIAEPGLVIPFSTSINLAENFFGKQLIGGDDSYSSSDYAVKIHSIGLRFNGYDALTVKDTCGLAKNPNVYLVPVGRDKMRTPAGTSRKTLAFNVIDQVLPLPYTIGSSELDSPDWVSTFSGFDGTSDSYAVIRRHSTMPASGEIASTRLFGRSVWNDRWLLIIPASSLSSDRQTALKAFINGIDSDHDGMIDVHGVSDIEIGLRAYSRSGN